MCHCALTIEKELGWALWLLLVGKEEAATRELMRLFQKYSGEAEEITDVVEAEYEELKASDAKMWQTYHEVVQAEKADRGSSH